MHPLNCPLPHVPIGKLNAKKINLLARTLILFKISLIVDLP